VDIGAELFAMSAEVSRATALGREGNAEAAELADLFCRHARNRVDRLFREAFGPDDVVTWKTAQRVLAGEHAWLESGLT
jgi:hypothetical protein